VKLTIDEYAKQYKISKNMIHAKLKAKELDYNVEDGTLYILVNTQASQKNKLTKAKPTVAMVIALYQKENQQLKEKIIQLEAKIDKLIDDKEQMLREEMQKIEKVYQTKDEQLKTILELMQAKQASQEHATIHDVLPTMPKSQEQENIIELKQYLKTLNLTTQEKKTIKKRFLNAYGEDIRLIKKDDGKIYLNFSKYDYSDFLA
jgi:hypothetical protein